MFYKTKALIEEYLVNVKCYFLEFTEEKHTNFM
jgi:hypothetical protein